MTSRVPCIISEVDIFTERLLWIFYRSIQMSLLNINREWGLRIGD